MGQVSVIMPFFNEEKFVGRVILEVLGQSTVKEIICVNDGSTDLGGEIAKAMSLSAESKGRIKYMELPHNSGKGKALAAGLKQASGEIVLFQDADLEYSPSEYPRILEPLLKNQADVVYGSRFLGGGSRRVLYFWHSIGNSLLTTLSNMLTNLNLTDMETGCKVFRRTVLARLALEEAGFGIEPEITAKLAKCGARFYEVPISYHGRSYNEGKKISWLDGFRAIYCIVKYSLAQGTKPPK